MGITIKADEAETVLGGEKKDAWYLIKLGTDRLGYSHHTYQNQTSEGKNTWKIDTAETINKTTKGFPYQKFSNTGSLNDNGSIQEVSQDYYDDEVEKTVSIKRLEGRMTFNYMPEGQVVELKLGADEDVYLLEHLGLGIIRGGIELNKTYSFKSIYWQGRMSQPIAEVTISVTNKVKRRVLDKDKECFVLSGHYNESNITPNKFDLVIDQEGWLIEKTLGGGETMSLVTADEAKRRPKDKFEPNQRIDPFTPKYLKITIPPKHNETGPESAGTEIKEPELMKLIKAMREQLDLMKQAMDNPSDNKDKILSDAYLKIRDGYEMVNKTTLEVYKKESKEIYQEANEIFPAAERIYNEAKYLRDEAERNFTKIQTDGEAVLKTGRYDKISEIYRRISELPNRREIKETEYEDRVAKCVQEVKKFNSSAEVYREFFTSKPVKVKGVSDGFKRKDINLAPFKINFLGAPLEVPLVYQVVERQTTVLINDGTDETNDKSYEAGVKIKENLSIKTISLQKIVFIYKGEEISMKLSGRSIPLQQKGTGEK